MEMGKYILDIAQRMVRAINKRNIVKKIYTLFLRLLIIKPNIKKNANIPRRYDNINPINNEYDGNFWYTLITIRNKRLENGIINTNRWKS